MIYWVKNIVIVGGGTGTFTLLSGLRKFPTNNAVIVSTADDGGSTGRLREELGVLPPGDLRQCLVGLSYTDPVLQDLFSYRFAKGSLAGHTVGNIILAALEKVTGDVERGIAQTAKMLNVRGEVVPVTLFPTKLSATLMNGKKIVGEHHIDEPRHDGNIRIKSLTLKPGGAANPRALGLIAAADAIIFGPGDLYTSTIPNLLVKGVAEAVRRSSAKKILITNLMTKHGQTDKFKASDFVKSLESYLGKGSVDAVIVNSKKPAAAWIARHKKEHSEFVEPDTALLKKMKLKVLAEPLLNGNTFEKNSGDVLKRSYLRHDPDKLAKLILDAV